MVTSSVLTEEPALALALALALAPAPAPAPLPLLQPPSREVEKNRIRNLLGSNIDPGNFGGDSEYYCIMLDMLQHKKEQEGQEATCWRSEEINSLSVSLATLSLSSKSSAPSNDQKKEK